MERKELAELQGHVMQTAADIIGVCERHGIPYYLIEGSLLGAVRHHIMIPWDDDIDIGIPRTHYGRLIPLLKAELPPYCRVTAWQDGVPPLRYFVQVENTRMRVIETAHIQEHKRFVWVDLFPLDGMPTGYLARMRHFGGVFFLRMLIQFSQLEEIVDVQKKRPLHERLLISFARKTHIGRNWDTKKLMERLDRYLTQYSCETSDYWINSMTAYKKKSVIPRSWYGDGRKMQFGPYRWNAPEKPDEMLRHIYGDYMQFLPEQERTSHSLVLDENRQEEP